MARSLTPEQTETLNKVRKKFIEGDVHNPHPPRLATLLNEFNADVLGQGPEAGELGYSTANHYLKTEDWVSKRAQYRISQGITDTVEAPVEQVPQFFRQQLDIEPEPVTEVQDEVDIFEVEAMRKLRKAETILGNANTTVQAGQGAVADVANNLLQTVLVAVLQSLTAPEELARMTPANKIQLLSTVQRTFKEFESLLQFEVEARKQLRATREEELQDAMVELGLFTRLLQDDMTETRRINLNKGLEV